MLDHAVQWMEIVESVADALLLIRILALRLNRLYTFLTLFCVLNVAFDVIAWWLGSESPANVRVSAYAQFLFAVVFPLVAWDIFEEVKTQAAKLRRLRAPRLVSGVMLSLIFGLIMTLTLDDKDFNGMSSSVVFVGLVMWVGSATTSLLFVWFVYKGVKSQNAEIPNNTPVLSFYVLGTLALAIFECAFSFFEFNAVIRNVLRLIFEFFELVITTWCTIRLKSLQSDVPSTPEKASL